MFTRETVCNSINEVREWPMTPDNVRTFADLLYIKERIGIADRSSEASESGLTPEMADRWVVGMENADGTRGAHWSMEATEKVRKDHGIAEDPLKWWITMNMMYSDYCGVAEKLGISSLDFYACMSVAFLDDKDARPDKLYRYYEYIVQK